MPHDLETFKNLCPFPNKDSIRGQIKLMVELRQISVPKDYDWVPVILEAYEFGLYRCNCGKEQLKDSKRYSGPRGNHTRVAGEICK